MKTIHFKKGTEDRLGVLTDKGVLDIQLAKEILDKPDCPTSLPELLEGEEKARLALQGTVDKSLQLEDTDVFLKAENIQYGPSVTNPQKILCVGLNYKKHAEESNLDLPEKPIIFSKFNNALCGHEESIPLPKNAKEFDYEGELAIIIGKKAKNVSQAEALSYVYGYSIANDFSARDLQFQSSQWLLGKSGDNFCPLGPILVSADELGNPTNLSIKTYVNNELRQDGHTSDMIFSCDEIISFLSQHMTLYPGDVILTGTPDGVILGYEDSDDFWLQAGDEIKVEIEEIGLLKNKLVES